MQQLTAEDRSFLSFGAFFLCRETCFIPERSTCHAPTPRMPSQDYCRLGQRDGIRWMVMQRDGRTPRTPHLHPTCDSPRTPHCFPRRCINPHAILGLSHLLAVTIDGRENSSGRPLGRQPVFELSRSSAELQRSQDSAHAHDYHNHHTFLLGWVLMTYPESPRS